MTKYVGEGYRVTSKPVDDDTKTALTGSMVLSLKVTIYSPAAVVLVDSASMAYDATLKEWFYMWNTVGLGYDPGSYKIKVVITGLDGRVNWEWQKVRLARDPIPVAP